MPKKIYRRRLSDTGEKVRNVVALIYLEDLEKSGKTYGDLLAFLDHKHFRAVVSPIHDRDYFTGDDVRDWCERHIDPETGDLDTHYLDDAPYVGKPKKPHCHVAVMSKGAKDAFHWTQDFEGLMHIRPSMWDKLQDYDAFVRYCAHLDSPQKTRYSEFDVVGFGGVDLSALLKTDKHQTLAEVTDAFNLAEQRNVRNFHTFVKMCFASGDMGLVNVCLSRGSLFASYYSSIQREEFAKWQMEHETDTCS